MMESEDERRVVVTIVIYLNKCLIIQTNSTFPDRERRAAQGLDRAGNSLDL